MANTSTSKTVFDFVSQYSSGQNSGLSPLLLQKDTLAFGFNCSLRGGYAKTRPPFQRKTLNFNGNADLKTLVTTGLFQGAGYYRPDFGTESLIAAISGHIILFTENGSSWLVTDVSVPNDLMSATASQIWMWQSEKWMIINDGSGALPVFFDGTTSRRSFGASQLWGTNVSAANFPSPRVIGEIITLTLDSPFSGSYNSTVIFNKEFYQPVASPSGYAVTLKNLTDTPSTTVVAGTQVIVEPSFIGTLAQSATAYLFGNSGILLDITLSFPISLTYGQNVLLGGLVWYVRVNTGDNIHYTLLTNPQYVGEHIGQVFPAGLFLQQAGNSQPNFIVGNTIKNFIVPPVNGTVTIQLNSPFTGSLGQLVQIGGAQYQVASVPSPIPSNALYLINLSDTQDAGMAMPIGNPDGNVMSVPELPAARMGAYGGLRNVFSLTDGISYEEGDIVGGAAGTQAFNYRDAVLKTTENDDLPGGGTFRLPNSGDFITAIFFPAVLDTSLGNGACQISTAFNIFGNNASTDRTTWENSTSPLQTNTLKGRGALGQNSMIDVNSDTMFRSSYGIASLILARRDFQDNSWGNKPISNEVQGILSQDNPQLLSFGSAIEFDNRYITTCSPFTTGNGIVHKGLLTLNNDLISSLRSSLSPAWEGLWTGLNVLQLLTGRVNGSIRAFAFSFNFNDSQIELWELLAESSAPIYQDNGETDIIWGYETPALFNKDVKNMTDLAQLSDGEVYLSKIQGTMKVQVQYRPDFYPCWADWNTFSVCSTNAAGENNNGYRMRIGLGEPSPDPVENGNNRPLRNGNFFQSRFLITGSGTINAQKLAAILLPQQIGDVGNDNPSCQEIDCVPPDYFSIYQLQGSPMPPSPTPTPPASGAFKNQIVYYNITCGAGTSPIIPALPRWITYDSGNNRLVGAAGTISGSTQDSANAQAQSAINFFGAGNVTCLQVACDNTILTNISTALAGTKCNIVGYTDGVTIDVLNHTSGGTPIWDGTFPAFFGFDGTRITYVVDQTLGSYVYISKGVGQDQFGATQGQGITLTCQCCGGVILWAISATDIVGNTNPIGYWFKIGGTTPEGTYHLWNGSDTPPGGCGAINPSGGLTQPETLTVAFY